MRGTDETSATTLAQSAAYLLAGSPGADTVTIAVPSGSGNPAAYLWVYVSLADYTDHWTMYSPTEQRLYAIEGSAMLAGPAAAVTFAGEVTPDGDGVVLLEGGSSPTWLQPLPTQNVGTTPPAVPDAEPFVESFFTSQQTRTDAVEGTIPVNFSTTSWTGTATLHYMGQTITRITLDYQSNDGGASASGYTFQRMTSGGNVYYYRFSSHTTTNGSGDTVYLGVVISQISITTKDALSSIFNFQILAADSPQNNLYNGGIITSGTVDTRLLSYLKQTSEVLSYYVMLQLSDGVPSDADLCDTPDESGRRNLEATITGDASPWTVTVDGTAYTVTKSGQTVTMKQGTTTVGTWQSAYSGAMTFFDAAVALRLPGEAANDAVRDYGLAPVAGDFSHAVATFEMGTQPSEAEMLGRLVRMSRGQSGEMSYLHPASGALASEIDMLRPVPRFYRADPAPAQTTCQPGLSVWYRRPASGSSAARAWAYDGGVVGVVAVAAPAFLQYALLALRAPAAFGRALRLSNAGDAVANAFALRFVVWRSDASMWDGSDSWGLAAMVTMPSVYQSDGPGSVSWSVDVSGSLMPLGARTATADRIGVSPVMSGAIAAGAEIDIPITVPVAAGDVVLVAPEVVGFADGGAAASATFGRQADPAGTDAEAHGFAWARYPENLGWFPRVVGF